jgi:hypothetical protein
MNRATWREAFKRFAAYAEANPSGQHRGSRRTTKRFVAEREAAGRRQ